MDTKYCPILSLTNSKEIAPTLIECKKEKCAWYRKDYEVCSINLIAGTLSTMM